MLINIIESNFELNRATESMLVMTPTPDMHEIEVWEDHFDTIQMPYALVECRKITKTDDIFLGYSLVTQLPLNN